MKTRSPKHLAALAATAVIALAPLAASAHGRLESAVPASGSTVDTPPDALRLTFSENLEPAFSSVKVSDAKGAALTKEKAKVDASHPRTMTITVPKLTSGTYTVQWTVVAVDGHRTTGAYTFKVK